MLKQKRDELDGRVVKYTSESVFHIETGKGKRASYKPRASFVGNLGQAVAWYRMLNIGYGFKKRLVCWTLPKPILARSWSD